MAKHIVVIPGDGIGEEITAGAVKVLQKIDEVCHIGLTFEKKPAGGTAYDLCGSPLPEDTIEAAKKADAILFGAVGGDKWDNVDPKLRPEQAVLGLRKALGLYVNLRPVKVPEVLAEYSPLKPDIVTGTDVLIVRELVGGIYFGDRCESEIHNGVERAWDLENYSVPEVQRISTFAMKAAQKRRHKVTSVDKANVLATSRLWREVMHRLAAEYPDVEFEDMLVDNTAMQLVKNPSQFDVVVTENMFGDILSDEASMLAGSLGMLPSASLGATAPGLYEPSHGSAPKYAGLDKANPIATILSVAMMFKYSLNLPTEAQAIEDAVDAVLAEGWHTYDIPGSGEEVGTKKMGQLIREHL